MFPVSGGSLNHLVVALANLVEYALAAGATDEPSSISCQCGTVHYFGNQYSSHSSASKLVDRLKAAFPADHERCASSSRPACVVPPAVDVVEMVRIAMRKFHQRKAAHSDNGALPNALLKTGRVWKPVVAPTAVEPVRPVEAKAPPLKEVVDPCYVVPRQAVGEAWTSSSAMQKRLERCTSAKGAMLCSRYLKAGSCKYGDSCRCVHRAAPHQPVGGPQVDNRWDRAEQCRAANAARYDGCRSLLKALDGPHQRRLSDGLGAMVSHARLQSSQSAASCIQAAFRRHLVRLRSCVEVQVDDSFGSGHAQPIVRAKKPSKADKKKALKQKEEADALAIEEAIAANNALLCAHASDIEQLNGCQLSCPAGHCLAGGLAALGDVCVACGSSPEPSHVRMACKAKRCGDVVCVECYIKRFLVRELDKRFPDASNDVLGCAADSFRELHGTIGCIFANIASLSLDNG